MKHLAEQHKQNVGEGVKQLYREHVPLCPYCNKTYLYLIDRRKAGVCANCERKNSRPADSPIEIVELTGPQVRALAEIVRAGVKPGKEFNPMDAFPERNKQDAGARRALGVLANKGVLGWPNSNRLIFTMTNVAYESYLAAAKEA